MKNPSFFSAAISIMAAGLCLAPCAGAYDISGKVLDSAGAAISGAKVRLQNDTTQSVTSGSDGAFHFQGTAASLSPIGAAEEAGLELRKGADGALLLNAPRSMPLSLTLAAMDGRVIRKDEAVSVSAGLNRLEKLTGRLRPGAYAMRLSGKDVSFKVRLLQGSSPVFSGALKSKAGASARALRKAGAAPDWNGKIGLAASKDGYAPMLYVPSAETETGVAITLKKPISKPGHIIVIYLENWSFDALYGGFAGAEGLAQAYGKEPQRDSNGTAYATLPRPWNTDGGKSQPDSAFPDTLSNKPFDIAQYKGLDKTIPDLVHRYYQEQLQIDGGKNDQFVAVSNARGLAMGYFNTDGLPLAAYAKQYTLCDHFFHSAFGGSFLNHQWLIAARTPLWADIPAKYRARIDSATGKVIKTADRTYADGQATPDGHLINTIYTVNSPHPATAAVDQLVPKLDYATIGDRLNEKGVDWAWYAGGWSDIMAGKNDSAFQFHHQPFAYFRNYSDSTAGRAAHLKDERDFVSALKNGALPPVAFLKPVGINNEHPSYTDVKTGELHTVALLEAIKASSIWSDALIIITYDEHGGFYDHVAPPVIDKWGPGVRVPTLLISPFAKKGYVDKHQYETVSILSLIERRYGLLPLSSRDASAADLTAALELPQ